MKLKKIIICCALCGCIASVGPVAAMASASSQIQGQIDSYTADLEASEQRSAELEAEIASLQSEVGQLYVEVASLDIERESYYQDMKTRMAYFYEEMQGQSLLSYLFGADSFVEFINRIQFQQSLYTYDAERMSEYQEIVEDLEEKQAVLDAEIERLGDMIEEQVVLQAALDAIISDKRTELDEAKAEEAAAEAAEKEAARRAETDAVVYAMSLIPDEDEDSQSDISSSDRDSDMVSLMSGGGSSLGDALSASGEISSSRDSGSSYDYPQGAGVLTKERGINYYNGHIETWYSQQVLSGTGLDIPGRHVDSRGIICDADGYICVASSDYPLGTVVETSLGLGKVYDSGCASGIIDIYTDW